MDTERKSPAAGNGEALDLRAALENNGFRFSEQRLQRMIGYMQWWLGLGNDPKVRDKIGDAGADLSMIALRDRYIANIGRYAIPLEALAIAILAAERDLLHGDPKFGAGSGENGPWSVQAADIQGQAMRILHQAGWIA